MSASLESLLERLEEARDKASDAVEEVAGARGTLARQQRNLAGVRELDLCVACVSKAEAAVQASEAALAQAQQAAAPLVAEVHMIIKAIESAAGPVRSQWPSGVESAIDLAFDSMVENSGYFR